jgi:hypothetical protein
MATNQIVALAPNDTERKSWKAPFEEQMELSKYGILDKILLRSQFVCFLFLSSFPSVAGPLCTTNFGITVGKLVARGDISHQFQPC